MTHHNQPSQPAFNHFNPIPLDTLTPLHDLVSASHLTPYHTEFTNLPHVSPQRVRWLWQHRIPLAGITLLDGDHGCAKSLLSLQIAAAVSSGSPMPDHTPTIQGGVVIITPHTDPTTTQLQLLTALGANLEHIQILSFVPDSASNSPSPTAHNKSNKSYKNNEYNTPTETIASTSHPFSLPEDSHALFQAIQRVNARLVIFDPFISLLSRTSRTTNERLCHLLADLNLHFIKQNIACLLIRNCPARGGHARPSLLERSDHFLTTSASRLLLTPDPFLPNRLLLCHALNRHAALTPTLVLQVRPFSHNPDLPHLTFLDSHTLQARDFIENRPDTLHRQILSKHLLTLLRDPANCLTSSKCISVSTLYTHSPHSSPFQIQRALNDLLNMGQIKRPSRGLYIPVSTSPTPTSNATAATTLTPHPESIIQPNATAATTHNPTIPLNAIAATTLTPHPELTRQLTPTPATTYPHDLTNILNHTPATTPTSNPNPTTQLNATAATTFIPDPHLTSHLSPADAALYNQVLESNWRMTYMDQPQPPQHSLSQQLQARKRFWDMDYGD